MFDSEILRIYMVHNNRYDPQFFNNSWNSAQNPFVILCKMVQSNIKLDAVCNVNNCTFLILPFPE